MNISYIARAGLAHTYMLPFGSRDTVLFVHIYVSYQNNKNSVVEILSWEMSLINTYYLFLMVNCKKTNSGLI